MIKEIMIYSLVVMCATISGAISGLGGGVIIKPLLDAVGLHAMATINFYSSLASFTMSVVSISKQIKNKFQFNYKVVFFIAVGSLIGGRLGEELFNIVSSKYPNNKVKFIQAFFLLVTLITIYIYTLNRKKIRTYKITNSAVILITGIILGLVSVFLGIGGGPLNLALLNILFSYNMKEASVYSITTIFFAQLSKLIAVYFNKSYLGHELLFIPFILIFAVLGGFVGTVLNQKLTNNQIEKFYLGLMLVLIGISFYNMVL